MSDDDHGKVDVVSVLYVALGIPGIIGFIWVVFALVKACNVPA